MADHVVLVDCTIWLSSVASLNEEETVFAPGRVHIRQARHVSLPDQQLKRATQELAEARAKQERATRHFKEAQEQLDKSTALLSYATAQHEAARAAVQT